MKESTRRRLRRLVSLLPDGIVRPVIYLLGLALTAQLLHAVVDRPRDAQIPEREPAIELEETTDYLLVRHVPWPG